MKAEIPKNTLETKKISKNINPDEALNLMWEKTIETTKDAMELNDKCFRIAELTLKNEEECKSFIQNNLKIWSLLPN
jgi:hypothetical protein